MKGETEGIRFNQLLEMAKTLIDPKISPPTLIRHLKYLQTKRIVKRKVKGSQNVVYSLDSQAPILTKEDIEFTKQFDKEQTKKLSAMKLERVIDFGANLSLMSELEAMIIFLERQLPKANQEKLMMKMEMRKSSYRYFFELALEAMKGRPEIEYKAAVIELKKRIAELRKASLNRVTEVNVNV